MTIKLDENYRIEKDVASWNLCFERDNGINPQTGRESISRDISYHPNLKQALIAYCDKSLSECASVEEVIGRIAELNTRIENLDFQGFGGMYG